jgi:hypothetical protein
VEIEPGEALPEAKGRFIANYIGGLRLGLWALTSPYRPELKVIQEQAELAREIEQTRHDRDNWQQRATRFKVDRARRQMDSPSNWIGCAFAGWALAKAEAELEMLLNYCEEE